MRQLDWTFQKIQCHEKKDQEVFYAKVFRNEVIFFSAINFQSKNNMCVCMFIEIERKQIK